MKIVPPVAIASILMIAMACTSSTAVDGPVSFHLLESGSNAIIHDSSFAEGGSRVLVIHDAVTFGSVWKGTIESKAAPAVDFSKQTAVILLLGSRRTGGYAVEAKGVTAAGSVITIDTAVKTPGKRAMVTDAISAPFVALALDRRGVTTVRWMSGDREIAGSSP